jgi:hypothetical protein
MGTQPRIDGRMLLKEICDLLHGLAQTFDAHNDVSRGDINCVGMVSMFRIHGLHFRVKGTNSGVVSLGLLIFLRKQTVNSLCTKWEYF